MITYFQFPDNLRGINTSLSRHQRMFRLMRMLLWPNALTLLFLMLYTGRWVRKDHTCVVMIIKT